MKLRNVTKIWIFFLTILFCFFIASFVLVFLLNDNKVIKIVLATFLILIATIALFFGSLLAFYSKRKSVLTKNSINFYVENLVSNLSIGLIVLESNGKIVWASNFIEERFGKKIINQSITNLIKEFNFGKKQSDFEKNITINNFVYKVNFIAKELIVTMKDITQEYAATHFYEIERPVIGEIDIDNFQQYQSLFSEEELFLIQSTVINLLESLSKIYNFSFRQYVNGKFIVFTNRDNLNKMMLKSFDEIEKLKENQIIKDVKISLSIGFGADSSKFSKLMEMAKEGLQQSQSRGGDQITIISTTEKPKHFGSKSEIAVLKSRTKIKNVANNFKNCLQNKDIKNVIIYGHKMADLDAIGAAYAIYEIAKHFNKEAYIQNHTFDNTTKKAIEKYIPNSSKIFISPSRAWNFTNKNTLVVVVDCADETRVENPKLFTKANGDNIFIFDHHRVGKQNSLINQLNVYIETSASSTCEIITEMIAFNQFSPYVSKEAAQMLLNGIYLDTSQFKKSTNSRTFLAASILEEWGANVEEAISILKMSQATNEIVMKILTNLREIKPGYWLASYKGIAPPDAISIAADEILRIDGRKAAFVIAKQPKLHSSDNDSFKLSARSIGVNVQLIAEAVGGGGHFNAAAAISDAKAKETLETFTDNVIQAIISTREE